LPTLDSRYHNKKVRGVIYINSSAVFIPFVYKKKV
jgi:hypothetical protein